MMAANRCLAPRAGVLATAILLAISAVAEAQFKFTLGRMIHGWEGPYMKREPSAFSPDGKLWARNAGDGKVVLWDLVAKREVAMLEHRRGVGRGADGGCHIEFSPDGRTLAVWVAGVGAQDTELALWNVMTRSQRSLQSPQGLPLEDMAFSPDGTRLATVTHKLGPSQKERKFPAASSQEVKIWDVATGREFKLLDQCKMAQVAYSSDGRWLATSHAENERNGQVILWDAETLEQRRKLKTDGGWGQLAFSPDSKLIAAALYRHHNNPDGRAGVRVWNVETGMEVGQLAALSESGLPQIGERIAFSPDSLRVVVGKANSTADSKGRFRIHASAELHLWNLTTRADAVLDQGPCLFDAQFSADGNFLATTFTRDETRAALGGIKLWDTKYWRVARTLKMDADADVTLAVNVRMVSKPRFSRDGRWLSAIGSNSDRLLYYFLWDLSETPDTSESEKSPGGP